MSPKAEVAPLLDAVALALKAGSAWITKFPHVLGGAEDDARTIGGGLEAGEVWQDRFVVYWREWDEIEEQLRVLEDKLDAVYLTGNLPTKLRDNVGVVIGRLRAIWSDRTRSKAQLSYAFQEPRFRPHPTRRPHHIAYEVKRLKDWAKNFEQWLGTAIDATNDALRTRVR